MTPAKLSKGKSVNTKPRIGFALAGGGGSLGAIYEIGALCALDESLNGLSFTRLQHYVGVSAGSFIAAGLADGARLWRIFKAQHPAARARSVSPVAGNIWRQILA